VKFIVYYSDNMNFAETIHSKNARDAAIKFLMKFPRDDVSQIGVEGKLFSNRDEDEIFDTLDLLHEVKIMRSKPIRTVLDKNILKGFDILLFEEIIQRHPEWLKYAKPHKEENYIVEIQILCPIKKNPSINISFGEGELSPVVGFGPAWYDSYYLRNMSGVSWQEWWGHENPSIFADAIDEFVARITSEEEIAAVWKSSFLSNKSGLIDSVNYKSLKENDKIIRSVSWLGTYNFNYTDE